ncbi:hypothetical protein DFJ74DRAFT_683927 [Hyaloraphidium curvatum]|nr:hypothetical protein DFJ74DRAFT_683927 [Hyaloraphidium curvatum]
MATRMTFRRLLRTCAGPQGARAAVRCAALLPLLALLASSPAPVSAASRSSPPHFSYENVTDPAALLPGCKETTHVECGGAEPCRSSYYICPEPCGSSAFSSGFPYACGAPNNWLSPTRYVYEAKLTVEGRPGRCDLRQHEWLVGMAPLTRGGRIAPTMCGVDADCPWEELRTTYGSGNVSLMETGVSGITVANITIRPQWPEDIANPFLWCAVTMGCPPDLAKDALFDDDVNADYRFADPAGTRYVCHLGEGGNASVLVKLDGKRDVACLTAKSGDRECRRLTPACCMQLDGTSVGRRGLPYLSCADVSAGDRASPDHFCARGRALLAQRGPPKMGPAPDVLGPGCKYVGDPNYTANITGPTNWIAATVFSFVDPTTSIVAIPWYLDPHFSDTASLGFTASFRAARHNADDSVSVLSSPADGLPIRFAGGGCADLASRTAPRDAPSVPAPESEYLTLLESVSGDLHKGFPMCVEGCPGSGQWIRGRRLRSFALVSQYRESNPGFPSSYGTPVLYPNSSCTEPIPRPDPTDIGMRLCSRPAADSAGDPWDPWCARIVAAVNNERLPGCAFWTRSPPAWACVASPADGGNHVHVRPVNVTRRDGTVAAVAQCLGPDERKCSWFADAKCKTLARNEPFPGWDDRFDGYTCGQEEGGWCRLAAEALELRPKSTSTESVSTTTAQTTTATATSTVTSWSLPTFFCVPSCLDRENEVLVYFLADQPHARCLGPDNQRCSWFAKSSNCTVLAPGEPQPDLALNVGKLCTDEEEGAAGSWCQRAKMFLKGNFTACPAVVTAPASRPSGASLRRSGADCGMVVAAFGALLAV